MTPGSATVFVVDDDASLCAALSQLLGSVGLIAETFANTEHFLRAVKPDRPGCLLLDVRVPGVSSLDLQSGLGDRGYGLPVILLTTDGDVPPTVRAMKADAVDVVTKPVDDQTLLEAVKHALERDRRQREERAQTLTLEERYLTLTSPQRQIMWLVVTGRLDEELAADLGTSVNTVIAQRGQMMHKMSALSVAELVRMADRLAHFDGARSNGSPSRT